ncbi:MULTISPECIES: pilus assembly PilX family protein [unclassified Luteimonas]
MNRPVAHPGARQSGVSLVIVLILLLVMTILGLAVMRGTLLEERMSANMYDRSLAFQQAESALREAEAAVRASVLADGKGWVVGVRCGDDAAHPGTITASLCSVPANVYTAGTTCTAAATKGTDCWFNANDRLGTANAALGITDTSAGAPQYYIQYMGLRDSADDLGLGASAGSIQYGGGGGGVIQEAMYRVFARSHAPAGNADRSVVVLQGNVVAR